MSDPTAPNPALLLIDRTAVLFCGVAAGVAIGLAFAPQLSAWMAEGPPVTVAAAAPAQAVGADGLPQAVAAAADVPAGLARAVAEKRAFRIGVFGDSFGDGLWAALYNQLPRREAFRCCAIPNRPPASPVTPRTIWKIGWPASSPKAQWMWR